MTSKPLSLPWVLRLAARVTTTSICSRSGAAVVLARGRSASDAETCDWRGDPHADRTWHLVRAGLHRLWRPPAAAAPVAADPDPTFHEFASEWFRAHRGEWAPKTALDYQWQLSNHLLPFLAAHRLSQTTIAEVDRYRQQKVDEGVLSAESINKTITRLGQILEVAPERELITRNPVRVNPRKPTLKAAKARPVHLDGADQIIALPDAAESSTRRRSHVRRDATP